MSVSEKAACPKCAEESTHVHSYQENNPRDLPILGKSVLLRVMR